MSYPCLDLFYVQEAEAEHAQRQNKVASQSEAQQQTTNQQTETVIATSVETSGICKYLFIFLHRFNLGKVPNVQNDLCQRKLCRNYIKLVTSDMCVIVMMNVLYLGVH